MPASQEPRIDVLINNAGAMFANRRLTDDGLECTFALNHMAYFVITEGLRERLLASAPARIVSTASAAHQGARLDFDDLQLAKSFGPMKAVEPVLEQMGKRSSKPKPNTARIVIL